MGVTGPLSPGAYVASIAVAPGVELGKDAIAKGLRRAGWEILKVHGDDEAEMVTFVGRLARPFLPSDTDVLTWSGVLPLPFDPLAPPCLTFVPYELAADRSHALWFYARRRSHMNMEAVCRGLRDMGWHVELLLELEAHASLPERPHVDVGWYLAIATWQRGDSALAGTEDPFFFAAVDGMSASDRQTVDHAPLQESSP